MFLCCIIISRRIQSFSTSLTKEDTSRRDVLRDTITLSKYFLSSSLRYPYLYDSINSSSRPGPRPPRCFLPTERHLRIKLRVSLRERSFSWTIMASSDCLSASATSNISSAIEGPNVRIGYKLLNIWW